MRLRLAGFFALLSASAMAQTPPAAAPSVPTTGEASVNAGEIAFDSEPNALKLPPDLYLGEAAGVAVNSKGHIFVFSRGNSTGPAYAATAAQLLEFDQNGNYLREIGHNLYAWSFAHTVRVDRYDNIWAVDKGSDMIIKFTPEGRVDMVYGRKKEASDEGAEAWKHPKPPLPATDWVFRQVTDVAWDAQDNVYISDGYINSRVAKVDKDGYWVKSWGSYGTGPGQFDTLHSIQTDAQGNVYVADRANGRIQVFDGDGKLERIMKINVPFDWDKAHSDYGPKPGGPNASLSAYGTALTMAPGSPWALCITPPPQQYLYVADSFPGRIYKMTLDGKILGVMGESGRHLKQFGWIHEMACPSENTLYTAEILNWRVQKLTLHPTADQH